MAAALYVLLLMQYTFLFKMDVLRVTRVVQLFLYLRLKYYEAKIQMLSVYCVFVEPTDLAQPRYVRMKILSFLKAYNTMRSARRLRNFCFRNSFLL